MEENMRRNILVGKIGKSVKFYSKLNIARGDGNDSLLFITIAKMHPNWNLWVVGPNDLNKLDAKTYDELFPNHNCKSIYAINKNVPIENYNDYYAPILDNICKEHITIDCALFFVGLVGPANIPNFLKTKKGIGVKPLVSQYVYSGPYIYVLNKTGVPFYSIAEDARYITVNAVDLYNRERIIFTQYNGNIESIQHILNENDVYTRQVTTHKAIYAHTEKIPLLGISLDWKNTIDINKKINSPIDKRFCVLSNGCGTNKINHTGNNISRLPVYKRWVHDITNDTEYEGAKVYGLWNDKIYKENPWIEEKLIVDMMNDIEQCRYSLVYSQVRGFVTAKPYELICLGIIPFIHPDYDPQRLLGLPEFLYVKTPEEMLHKMRRMDENVDGYKKVLNICMDIIKPEYNDGTFVINGIFRHIANDLGWDDYVDAAGVDVKFNHFSNRLYPN